MSVREEELAITKCPSPSFNADTKLKLKYLERTKSNMNELCPLYNTEICLVLDFCLMAIKTLSFLTSITLTRTRQSTLREKKSSIHNIIKSCPSFVTHCHINSFEVNMMSCLISCPTFRCSLSPVEQTHHGRSV